jgi:hypothetical protein
MGNMPKEYRANVKTNLNEITVRSDNQNIGNAVIVLFLSIRNAEGTSGVL